METEQKGYLLQAECCCFQMSLTPDTHASQLLRILLKPKWQGVRKGCPLKELCATLEGKLMESSKQILGKGGYPRGADARPFQDNTQGPAGHFSLSHRHQAFSLSLRSQRKHNEKRRAASACSASHKTVIAESLRRNPADPGPQLPFRRPLGPLISVHTTQSTELAMVTLHL